MIDQKFGKLTVISGTNYSDKWICQCSCGNFAVILGTALRTGLAKSCEGLEILPQKDANHRIRRWVRRNKPRPELCERCNESPATDLSSDITNKKECSRAFADYKWLCRSCRFLKAMRKSKDIYEIRKSYACGTLQKELAVSYRMSIETIDQIIQYKGIYTEMK